MKTNLLVFLCLLCVINYTFSQQVRPYKIIYSGNVKGDFKVTGNTVLAAYKISKSDTTYNAAMNASTTSNDNLNMLWINNDPAQGFNTFNSSTAALSVPVGASVTFARLYWGGRLGAHEYDLSQTANRQVRISKDNGSYYSVTAQGLDSQYITRQADTAFAYQMYSDITDLLNNIGANGSFTVGNIPCSQGTISGGGAFGGWSMVVVYSNNADTTYRAIRVYDGYQYVINSAGTAPSADTTILSGFNIPSSGLTAHMGIVGWEGDAAITGDYLSINNTNFSDDLNAANNSWNASSSIYGAPSVGRYPSFSNNMSIDVDDIDAAKYLIQNSSNATLIFGTTGDGYYPSYFAFAVNIKNPVLSLQKTVSDANADNKAQPLEMLSYNLAVHNRADSGSSYLSYVTDTLPAGITYVPQSMWMLYHNVSTPLTDQPGDDVAKYDAASNAIVVDLGIGANALQGGEIKPEDSIMISFSARVNDTINGSRVPIISNTARVTGQSAAGNIFYTDNTATILPDTSQKSLPVSLLYFNAHAANAVNNSINWATTAELNNKTFEVQRSIDGIHFVTISKIAGALNSNAQLKYTVNDDVKGVVATEYFYRLKQTDYNGNINYTRVVIIYKEQTSAVLFSASPNPATDNVNVALQLNNDENVTIKISSIAGQLMMNKNISGIQGANIFNIDVASA